MYFCGIFFRKIETYKFLTHGKLLQTICVTYQINEFDVHFLEHLLYIAILNLLLSLFVFKKLQFQNFRHLQ